MKNTYAFLFFLLSIAVGTFAQEVESRVAPSAFQNVRNELKVWDPVRGPWLASSMEAMAMHQRIPDRTFPENFTPYQLMSLVPSDTRANILRFGKEQEQRGDASFWASVNQFVESPNCGTTRARSYGDPHIVSYDGARYSFQTVGEFVLTKSENGHMEVQTRQRAMSDEFSLNTAVAMNVAGDKVSIYARDYPDAAYSTPVRLNGAPLHLNASTYFLDNGGTIRKSGNEFVIDWPSGESVLVKMQQTRNFDFMNVTVQIPNCRSGSYTGVLGNANGRERDDFNAGTVSPPFASRSGNDGYWQREQQAYMAKQFADVHRVQQMNSLFDYPPGLTTESFTDRTYPRVYPTMDDFNQRKYERSRRYCQSQGVGNRDLEGCAYDHMALGIDAEPERVIQNPAEGTVLRPVEESRPNVNPTRPKTDPVVRPIDSSKELNRPMRQEEPAGQEKVVNEREKPSTISRPDPVRETKPSRPKEIKQVPAPSRPRPAVKPQPSLPRPAPKPAPVPKPKPNPVPTQNSGRIGPR